MGYHSFTTTTNPSNVNLPSSGQQSTARLSARKVSVAGGKQSPRSPGQGRYKCSNILALSCFMLYIWTALVLFVRLWKSSEFMSIIPWQINELSGYTDTPRTYAIIMFRKIRRKSNFAQVGTQYTYGEPCSYMHKQAELLKSKL